jgi:hypothetical protein
MSKLQPSPPEEEREIESSAGGSVISARLARVRYFIVVCGASFVHKHPA